jgi:hypothetical protein
MKKILALAALAMLVSAAVSVAEDAPKMSAEQQAMMEKMTKAATPGPHHEMIKKMVGEWTCAVHFKMDAKSPMQESQSSATITSLMDGRYAQETSTGQMMGMPFNGMGIYGYDNVIGKYVSTWVDNMGTGMMMSQGTPDASGKVINWVGSMNDPVTGKPTKERMTTTWVDDNHYTLEMYGTPPGSKQEMKMMTIEYARK